MDYIETSHLKKKSCVIYDWFTVLSYSTLFERFAFDSVGSVLWPGDWYGDWTGAFYRGVLLHGP